MLAAIIKAFFSCFTLFLFVRVIGSWIPQVQHHKFMRFIAYYTDPYLNIFKRVVPPIGGVLDVSPFLGFLFLQILEKIIFHFIR